MNGILENIHIRKNEFTKLQKVYQMKEHEKKTMNQACNNECDSVFILGNMPNICMDWI